MLDLLVDVGVQCTQKDYKLAEQAGARKMAKRIFLNIANEAWGMKEHKEIPMEQTNEIPDWNTNDFDYDVREDAKGLISSFNNIFGINVNLELIVVE